MINLYFKLIGARVRSQMQYRVSFWLELLGFLVVTGLEFATIAILLGRFKSVGGWGLPEVALLYGLTSLAFSLAEMAGRGFDAPFERMMVMGGFDGVLARPLGAFFQVLTAEFQLRRLGRSAQAVLVLAYAFSRLPIAWSADRLLLLPVTVISGFFIYLALIVIGATLCFWTTTTPEVINVFTFGGEQMASYPLSIYQGWLRAVFLFIIPVGFSNYPAALYLLGRADPHGLPGWPAWLGAPGRGDLLRGGAEVLGVRGEQVYVYRLIGIRDECYTIHPSSLEVTMALIEVEDLRKSFSRPVRRPGRLGALRGLLAREYVTMQAVAGVSFAVEAGEMVGYIGPNGAGKSTTIKMLTGILVPSGGRVEVDGLVPAPRAHRARRAGSAWSSASAPSSGGTCRWSTPSSCCATSTRSPPARYRDNLRRLRASCSTWSRSWTRRCASSRSASACAPTWPPPCCTSPAILFLDEPTIGLDVVAKQARPRLPRPSSTASAASP